jgi:hypothetical protein
MKGFIEEQGWLVIEIVLIVIFIVAIVKITSSLIKPDEQIALMNTEIIRAGIEQACIEGSAEINGISLTQPKPSKLYGLTDVMPRTFINLFADPQYLLYYETFPPGEAIGWEVYDKSLGTRAISPIQIPAKKIQQGMTYITFKNLAKSHKDNIKQKINNEQKTVFIPNIVLSDELDIDPAWEFESLIEPKSGSATKATELKLGKWNKQENYYAFTSDITRKSWEKSLIKYRSCGENNLCLKTRSGIYTFPLDACKDKDGKSKIDYIKLVYDARGTGFSVSGNYKVSNFYLASPCEIKGDIYFKYNNDCRKEQDVHNKKADGCKETITYDTYKFEDGKFKKDGQTTICAHSIGGDTKLSNKKTPCIQIVVTETIDDFCWTTNPKLSEGDDNPTKIKSFLEKLKKFKKDLGYKILNTQTKVMAWLGGLPVLETTSFISPSTIVLSPWSVSDKYLKQLKDRYIEKGLFWAWPGAGS